MSKFVLYPLGAVSMLMAPLGHAAGQESGHAPAAVIVGEDGRRLVRHETGLKPTSHLKFRQIGQENTEGFVVNSVKGFNVNRLPATFEATLPSGEVCTATLVGPTTLLTAAHCVDAHMELPGGGWKTVEGTIARRNGTGSVTYGSCMMAPAYAAVSSYVEGAPRNGSDFAFCELDTVLTGTRAETITTSPSAISHRTKVMLAGYGCTQDALVNFRITPGSGGQGKLNVGMNSTAVRLSKVTIALTGRIGSDEAIICPGDSGGAAYVNASVEEGNDLGWRIAAVNSAVGPSDGADIRTYTSYLASLDSVDFHDLLARWKAKKAAVGGICGVDLFYPNGTCRK